MRPWLKSILSVSIAISSIIVLFWIGALKPVELFFARTIAPVSHMLYGASIYIHPGFEARTVQELAQAYIEVESELAEVLVDTSQLEDIRKENDILREQLSFLQDRNLRSLGADVIGRQVDPSESTLLINVGREQGIDVDMPVITGNGILIGTIARTAETYSLVRLLTDANSAIAATIISEDRSIGVINGGFGITVQMNLIPQNERVVPGDLIITSGLTAGIPRGLFIGRVESVEREAYQPFQRAVITPAVRLDKVTVVSVITGV